MTTPTLTEFAAVQQREFEAVSTPEQRKLRGHFGTPASIAEFMANLYVKQSASSIRVLDPGAGVGMLSAAICQRMLEMRRNRAVLLELWESDPAVIPFLERTMSFCRDRYAAAGRSLNYVINNDDFLFSNRRDSLFERKPQLKFDLAILNPPYFKLRKDSEHARVMSHVVHGQPNIYSLFMAHAATMLDSGADLIAITPRSYFNGPYFKRFRNWFLERMTPRRIHIFESRKDAFRDDAVLQENVILSAESAGKRTDILVSSSIGREFHAVTTTVYPYHSVIDNSNGDNLIRIASNGVDAEVVRIMDLLPHSFRSLGYEVSTGPVVSFRSKSVLRTQQAEDTAPLLWMHNVRPFVTRHLVKLGKPSHIHVGPASERLLVDAKWYVLLKRFSAKEEKRRLVAGVMQPSDSYSRWVGLENHLNYVYRKGKDLTREEAFGLAAFFNSALVDRYFRSLSGNTQVNASEIRSLPLPSTEMLMEIGQRISLIKEIDAGMVETVVCNALGVSGVLLHQLVEGAR